MSQKSKIKNVYSDLFGVSSDLFNDKNDFSFIGMDFNSIDRAIHKKQKCPKNIINFKKEYEELYDSFKKFLIREINCLYDSDVIDTKVKYPIKIMNMNINDNETRLYFNNSKLWNGKYTYCDIKSNKFKARFLANLYCELKLNLNNIIETQFIYKGRKIMEYEDKYSILYELIETVKIFTHKYIMDEYDFDDFIKLNKIFCAKNDVKKRRKVIKTMKNIIPSLLKTSESLFIKPENQYEFINDLINIAYVVSTENHKIKDIHRVPERISFPAYYAMKSIIVNLGEDIYVQNITHKSTPIIYRAFINAHPMIWTKYEGTEYNKFLSQGIKSIFYLSFITNDKNLYKYIKKII